jgi:hypothetical protein
MQVTEKFELNQNTSGIIASDGVGTNFADIWDYKPPLHTRLRINAGDIFSCYLVGDDAAEMPAKTRIRIVKRDVANEQAKPILPDTQYALCKSFTNKKQLLRLRISQEVVVETDEHLVIMVSGADAAGTGDTDASASHFKLECLRERKALD